MCSSDLSEGFINTGFDCIRGFSYGLQYDPASYSDCYNSLSESIDSAQSFYDLFKELYNPTVWADIALSAYNYQVFLSAVIAYCDVQKLINTITVDISQGLSTMAARVGGGFINEIPK